MESSQKIAPIERKRSGPSTVRGKAIVAQNATKHGVFSQKPPLLATEDLATFEGMIQGLIDEYEPHSPSEHILVQQAAMSWLRLHRLWTVEAALADEAMLKAEKATKFPADLETAGNMLAKLGMGKSQQNELEALEQNISEAAIVAAPMTVDTERLSRQERHLNRLMHDAIERLNQIKSQRQQENSRGLFGQK